MVRQQFEDWLETVAEQEADDIDAGRAERLNDLLQKSRWHRQRDLADEVGVETRTVQRWLDGGGISKRHWDRLAEALDTTVRYLIFGDSEPHLDVSQMDRIEAMLADLVNRVARIEAVMPSVGDVLEAELGGGSPPPRQLDDGSEEDEPEDQAEGR